MTKADELPGSAGVPTGMSDKEADEDVSAPRVPTGMSDKEADEDVSAPRVPTGMSDKEADEDVSAPRGWYSRGYLPHFETDCCIQAVTYRLADSLPIHVAERLANEPETKEGNARYRGRIEAFLDAGHGECLLRVPAIADLVIDSWRHFDGERYNVHSCVVMPNHVHILVQTLSPHLLQDAVKGWKSFTARKINDLLGQQGSVWQREYWDRYIRDEAHYERVKAYIHENPVKAGLAKRAEDWLWSSAGSTLGAPVSPPA